MQAPEARFIVPLAALPPESNVTGPTLAPPKLPNCKVNACPGGNLSSVARSGPAPLVKAKDRLVRSLAATGASDELLLPHPRTVSVPMTSTRAIHCAMRRGRAVCETARGRVINSSLGYVLAVSRHLQGARMTELTGAPVSSGDGAVSRAPRGTPAPLDACRPSGPAQRTHRSSDSRT